MMYNVLFVMLLDSEESSNKMHKSQKNIPCLFHFPLLGILQKTIDTSMRNGDGRIISHLVYYS